MQINSAMSTALAGIQHETTAMVRQAQTVARGDVGPIAPLLEMRNHLHQAEADAKVLQRADDALGTILDIMV
jgi:hypothetical protein